MPVMGDRQFATPVLVRNGRAAALQRIEFDDDFHDEDWVQQLLFEHPELIPFDELAPEFNGSVAVAREVESGAGPIDLLYVNGDGLLTLVETKLWRNAQSRREVVSQLFHYAGNLARATYDQLTEAAADAAGTTGDVLAARARAADPRFDPRRFHDAVTRNLKRGRFLLLVVGDGIRADVEAMAEYLQTQPHLGFTLGLVELALFRADPANNDTLFVQPRVVARTREVVRAVVEVTGDGGVRVKTPPEPIKPGPGRFRITDEEFVQQLAAAAVGPEGIDFVREVVTGRLFEHPLNIEWMQSGPLLKYVDDVAGKSFTLGGFHADGGFHHLFRLRDRCRELGLPDAIWSDYFDAVVRLVPGARRKHSRFSSGNEREDVVYDGKAEPVQALMRGRQEWISAVDQAVAAIKVAMAGR